MKEEALTLDNDTFNKLFAEAQTEWVKDGTTVKGNTTGKKRTANSAESIVVFILRKNFEYAPTGNYCYAFF